MSHLRKVKIQNQLIRKTKSNGQVKHHSPCRHWETNDKRIRNQILNTATVHDFGLWPNNVINLKWRELYLFMIKPQSSLNSVMYRNYIVTSTFLRLRVLLIYKWFLLVLSNWQVCFFFDVSLVNLSAGFDCLTIHIRQVYVYYI